MTAINSIENTYGFQGVTVSADGFVTANFSDTREAFGKTYDSLSGYNEVEFYMGGSLYVVDENASVNNAYFVSIFDGGTGEKDLYLEIEGQYLQFAYETNNKRANFTRIVDQLPSGEVFSSVTTSDERDTTELNGSGNIYGFLGLEVKDDGIFALFNTSSEYADNNSVKLLYQGADLNFYDPVTAAFFGYSEVVGANLDRKADGSLVSPAAPVIDTEVIGIGKDEIFVSTGIGYLVFNYVNGSNTAEFDRVELRLPTSNNNYVQTGGEVVEVVTPVITNTPKTSSGNTKTVTVDVRETEPTIGGEETSDGEGTTPVYIVTEATNPNTKTRTRRADEEAPGSIRYRDDEPKTTKPPTETNTSSKSQVTEEEGVYQGAEDIGDFVPGQGNSTGYTYTGDFGGGDWTPARSTTNVDKAPPTVINGGSVVNNYPTTYRSEDDVVTYQTTTDGDVIDSVSGSTVRTNNQPKTDIGEVVDEVTGVSGFTKRYRGKSDKFQFQGIDDEGNLWGGVSNSKKDDLIDGGEYGFVLTSGRKVSKRIRQNRFASSELFELDPKQASFSFIDADDVSEIKKRNLRLSLYDFGNDEIISSIRIGRGDMETSSRFDGQIDKYSEVFAPPSIVDLF